MAIVTKKAMDPNEYTDKVFQLVIQNSDTVYADGKARAVSSQNVNGIFDILPLHGDCIALVENFIIVYSEDDKEKTIPIHKGVLRVEKGNVFIFLDSMTV